MEQSWTLPPSLALWKAQKRAALKTRASLVKQEAARADFPAWLPLVTPSFKWDWKYLQYIQRHLDNITTGEINRLMLFIPPRHGKSEMVTVRYPVWRLEQDPTLRVIIGGYNQILSNKFSRKARRIAESRFPLAPDRQAVEDWETPQGGGLRAIGVGAGITGQGGHLIVIDDPVKSREEAESDAYRDRVWDWYRDDLYTRLEPGGAIILIMTRWHEDDLAGRILASEDGPNWTVVSLPAEAEENDPLGRKPGEALCPARYDEEALARIRTVLGPTSYYALFQQRPQPPRGSVFVRDWFPRRNVIVRDNAALVVQAWDTAFKDGEENDRSACVTLAMFQNEIHVLDAYRDTLAYPDLIRAMQRKAGQWRPDVLMVEDKGSGISALQTLRAQSQLPIIAVPARGSKIERANQVTATCEAGRVVFPATAWAEDLLDELVRFPTGAHDDQVDAFVYALKKLVDGMFSVTVSDY